ncbi:maltokinase N-terminal cap-like domain-containing protein [Microlunatus parietis]|uniref:Maltokinase n=1 Tax=Microlunatus parietis TaxID=682979 RepID=A0A7Y9L973_9ACTN|nr:phosphotransferase [Microlunatus parietis]NYE69272.1 maltokinase [Microlunatus parietis]
MSDSAADPDADRLLGFLTASRWFAGKGRSATLRSVTPLPWLRSPGDWPAVRIEIAEIGYPDAPGEFYQIPLAYRPAESSDTDAAVRVIDDQDHGALSGTDATDDPVAGSVIMSALLAGTTLDADHGRVVCRTEAAADLSADLAATRLTAEQSNTSVRYGDRALLKIFRRLELGDNLDITVHRALNRAETAGTARLYGQLTAEWESRGTRLRADLAMLTELFPHAEDGWELAVAAAESGTDFTDQARQLGVALAEVHRALGSAFPAATRAGDEIAAGMVDRLQRTREFAEPLNDHADALRARFERLNGRTLETQRVHGDFHLGQTLHTPDGWKIIDFEGEPAKPMAERLLPDSPWRDVAGMLRSFDYAVADSPEAEHNGWATAVREAFLSGYTGDDQLVEDDLVIIDAYVADKAVYELGYEIRNRPDWVRIPLSAIARIAGSSRTHQPGKDSEDEDHG